MPARGATTLISLNGGVANRIPCGDDLESEAEAAAERLETEYDTHRLAVLAKHDGREGP